MTDESEGRTVLVVGAHPDDEVLGCGGTVARLAAAGGTVHVLFLADGVTARGENPASAAIMEQRMAAARAACTILGAQPPWFLGLPDNRLDTVPLLDIVQQVEAVVADVRPDLVYTHHGGDLNVDHRIAHQAVMTACRPLPGGSVRAVYSFEVPSSTEWASPACGPAFRPNRFVDIGRYLDCKMRALEAYGAETRAFPHPRSKEAVEALARVRGARIGVLAAEAFVVERELL